jgi:flagellar biosynthesis chaperone FliJ
MQDAARSTERVIHLQTQLSAAQQTIEQHLHQLAKQTSDIAQLEEFIRSLRHKPFGASSEVQDPL